MQRFLQFISSIIAPTPTSTHIHLETHIVGEEEDEEEGYVAIDTETQYATEQEANRALVKSYYAFMEAHFGRKPQYVTDLYCNMLMTFVRGKRLWWIPTTHPIAIVLKNHFDDMDMDGSKGTIGEKNIGDCVIYDDHVIKFVFTEMIKLFQDENIQLQEKGTPQQQKKVE